LTPHRDGKRFYVEAMVRVLPTNIPPFRRLPTMQKKLCRLPFLNEAVASSTLFQLFFLSGATQDPEDIARILQQHVQTQTYFLLLLIPNRSGGREREKNPPKKPPPSHKERTNRVRQIVRPDECTVLLRRVFGFRVRLQQCHCKRLFLAASF